MSNTRILDVGRIATALQAAASLLETVDHASVFAEQADGHLVTAVDRAVNELLYRMLPQDDEGWLSEESADNSDRLTQPRVWIVDPLDGTKQFLAAIPEWCVSIALVERGAAVAGGVCNPTTGETFLGSRETGLHFRIPDTTPAAETRDHPLVLVSRAELEQGEWEWLRHFPVEVRGVGSVAYRLALVAADRADATWTFIPRHEWDVAGGAALVLASSGKVQRLNCEEIAFNQSVTQWDGLVAFSATAHRRFGSLFDDCLSWRSKKKRN